MASAHFSPGSGTALPGWLQAHRRAVPAATMATGCPTARPTSRRGVTTTAGMAQTRRRAQQRRAAPAAPQNPIDMRQAYLDALSNPGKVTTPGAQMLPGTSPTGPQSQPSVLAQFLQQHPGGGTTGGGGYTNQPILQHPERAEAGRLVMIGTELLQLLQGDPLAQMRQQMGGPNPNPQAPPPRPAAARAWLATESSDDGECAAPTAWRAYAYGWRAAAPGSPASARRAPPPPPPLPQSGPPSVASQSPPDLVSLYGRLMQQQRSGSAIDHGLALMASAYAAPGTQGQIMHSMDNQQQDPSAMMNNLVQLQQMQNMQNSRPAIVAALTGGVGDGSSGGIGGLPANVVNSLPTDTLLKMLDQRQQAAIQLQQKQAEVGHRRGPTGHGAEAERPARGARQGAGAITAVGRHGSSRQHARHQRRSKHHVEPGQAGRGDEAPADWGGGAGRLHDADGGVWPIRPRAGGAAAIEAAQQPGLRSGL